MEQILQEINANYISLSEEEILDNNRILHEVLAVVKDKLGYVSPLFRDLFKEIYYGGSYYDGLKVGKPNEYDIDLLLKFPRPGRYELEISNKPGYVWMKVTDSNNEFMKKFVSGSGYLDTQKVASWMHSILQLAFNSIPVCGALLIDGKYFEIRYYKSGPAYTLQVRTLAGNLVMDIDLVPCFLLNTWPTNGFAKNPTSEGDIFIVPKPLPEGNGYNTKYWRMSFQKQERKLMANLNRFKPTVRLLKKLRQSMEHDSIISSYYIKTVALWEISNQDQRFWNKPLSEVFMTVLRKYQQCIENKTIPYFWYKKKNLLCDIHDITLANFSGRLKRAINDIDRHLEEDPYIVANYILSPSELRSFRGRQSEPVREEMESSSKCIIL